MSQAVREALGGVSAARGKVEEAVRRDYPAGSEIKWRPREGHYARGKVIRHGYFGRIQVKNDLTGVCYWIEADKIGWNK